MSTDLIIFLSARQHLTPSTRHHSLPCIALLVGILLAEPASSTLADLDLTVLRSRSVAAVADCAFSDCPAGDFNDDSRVNAADLSAALQIPRADPDSYKRLLIGGDPSQSGVFDASIVLSDDDNRAWMAYSGVDYVSAGGIVVRDVTTRIARSDDDGASWQVHDTIAPPAATTVTLPSTALCGQRQCEGRMISEVPLLLDDADDPEPARRFKLFTHRYFLFPPAQPRGEDTQYQLGSINMRTAPSAGGPWSEDRSLLGWNLTPPEVQPAINVNGLNTTMSTCLALSEVGGAAFGGVLHLVFVCPYLALGEIRQRIVLLRSIDHAMSFTFVGIVLDDSDAAIVGADGFSAPELFVSGGRTYLLATPVVGSPPRYAGCVLIGLTERETALAERDAAGSILVRRLLPTANGRFGGACTRYRRARSDRFIMSQLGLEGGVSDPFRLYAAR